MYKLYAYKNVKYGVAVCVGTGRTDDPASIPHLHTYTALIYIAVCIKYTAVCSLITFSGFWI